MSDKEQYIKDLFSRIAGKYDLINDLMTFSMHRAWKKKMIKLCEIAPQAKVLDLCTGTGDIAYMWAYDSRVKKVVGLDSCKPMLLEAATKKLKEPYQIQNKIEFIEGDALEIPFNDNEFDAVTVGFGLRNVQNLDQALKEIKRVLKPGGYMASLDLGHPPVPLINSLYQKLFLKFVPILGASCAKDKAAYNYLVESLKTWPTQKALCERLWKMKFSRAFFKNIMLGAIAIVVAQK